MRNYLISILLFLSLSLSAQFGGRYPFSTPPVQETATATGAVAMYGFEGDLTDMAGSYDMTGTVEYTSAAGYFGCGSQGLNLNAPGRYASTSSGLGLSNTNGWTIAFVYRKGSFSGTVYAIDMEVGNDGIRVQLDGAASIISVFSGNGTNTQTAVSSAGLSSFINQINSVVVTSAGDGTLEIYYNGTDVHSSGTVRTDASLNEVLSVGSSSVNFYGYVDCLQISDFHWDSSDVATFHSDPSTEITKVL